MKSTQEHRDKLLEISDYAFAHGINAVKFEIPEYSSPQNWDENIKNIFLFKCHEGFKKAQSLIIAEILEYQKILRQTKSDLKEFRRQRDKESEVDALAIIDLVEHRLLTFTHIADGIAWQLIMGQIHIARRLYIKEEPKFLDSSNLEHAIKVADIINEKPEDFALISDITNFVQIGDLLVRHKDKLGIMELKEGKVNEMISTFLHSLDGEDIEAKIADFMNGLDKNTLKQVGRILRQQERGFNATEVINNDKGIDPMTGQNIVVDTPKIYTEYYYDKIHELIEGLKEKNWVYGILDNACVHIGMYKGDGRLMAPNAIKKILQDETENFMLFDFQEIISNVSQPLFAKPFSPTFMIDILVGEIKMIIGIDFDALIEMFKDLGLKAEWVSKKETAKMRQTDTRKTFVTINGRAIRIADSTGQKTMLLGGGLVSKICFDNIYPSNIGLALREGPLKLDNDEEEE